VYENLNVELLLKVKDQILREPSRFNMGYWGWESCGTTCCIAGLAHIIDCLDRGVEPWDPNEPYFDPDDVAGALGIGEHEKQDRLFYATEWPGEFQMRYEEAQTREERARVAADYIDHVVDESLRYRNSELT
jgi:hypothetical protein